MDLVSFVRFTFNARYMTRWIYGGLILCIPVANFFSLGFLSRASRLFIIGGIGLPTWQDKYDIWIEGVKLLFIFILYGAIPFFMFSCGFFLTTLTSITAFFGNIIITLSYAALLICSFFLPFAFATYAEKMTRQISKLSKLAKVGDHAAREEAEVLREIEAGLNKGTPARRLKDTEKGHLKDVELLTAKPVLYVANISERDLSALSHHQEAVIEKAGAENAPVVAICGKLEAEIEDLGEAERKEFLNEYGLVHLGLETLVHEGYRLLSFITFYTVVSKELRAWTLIQGTKAPQAAGKIHSDMEKGFIKAEVISFNDFVGAGSLHHAREKGLIALEGRDYEVRDGDIITFRFNA